jgi:hypothetical protein
MGIEYKLACVFSAAPSLMSARGQARKSEMPFVVSHVTKALQRPMVRPRRLQHRDDAGPAHWPRTKHFFAAELSPLRADLLRVVRGAIAAVKPMSGCSRSLVLQCQ